MTSKLQNAILLKALAAHSLQPLLVIANDVEKEDIRALRDEHLYMELSLRRLLNIIHGQYRLVLAKGILPSVLLWQRRWLYVVP